MKNRGGPACRWVERSLGQGKCVSECTHMCIYVDVRKRGFQGSSGQRFELRAGGERPSAFHPELSQCPGNFCKEKSVLCYAYCTYFLHVCHLLFVIMSFQ